MSTHRAPQLNYPWHIPETNESVRKLVCAGEFTGAIGELGRLAALGSEGAGAALAYLYLRGTTLTKQNFKLAESLSRTAALKGHGYSCYVMGWVAFIDNNDAVSATTWWERAAKADFSPGALEIARFLATDLPGKPPLIERAVREYGRASSLGHKAASLLAVRLINSRMKGTWQAFVGHIQQPFLAFRLGIWTRLDPLNANCFLHYPNASLDLFVTK